MSAALLAFVRARMAETEPLLPPVWLDARHPASVATCPACGDPTPCRVRLLGEKSTEQDAHDRVVVDQYAEALARPASTDARQLHALELAVRDLALLDDEHEEFRPEWRGMTFAAPVERSTEDIVDLLTSTLTVALRADEDLVPAELDALAGGLFALQASTDPGGLGSGLVILVERLLDEAAAARLETREEVWQRVVLEFAARHARGAEESPEPC